MFLSKLDHGTEIIDDNNYRQFVPSSAEPDGGGYGYLPRDWNVDPYGSFFPTFESLGESEIPRDQWSGYIEELERTQTRLSDLYNRRGWPKPNQNGTNFCHGYAVTSAMKLDRSKQNGSWKAYSAESVCAPIGNFRNVGCWSSRDARWIAEKGVCTEETWPAHRYSSNYYTDQNKTIALGNRITSFVELTPRRFGLLMTQLIRRRPCPIGLNWWSHAICAADPVRLGADSFGVRILNSHNDGFAKVLTEGKATPDDVLALYDVMSN